MADTPKITLPFQERDAGPVIDARHAGGAGIAVKPLADGRWVACFAHRCAILKSVTLEGTNTWLPADALAQALGAEVGIDRKTHQAVLRFNPPSAGLASGIVQVGMIAPDLQLTTLAGKSIRLSELAGKRVLINSWASW